MSSVAWHIIPLWQSLSNVCLFKDASVRHNYLSSGQVGQICQCILFLLLITFLILFGSCLCTFAFCSGACSVIGFCSIHNALTCVPKSPENHWSCCAGNGPGEFIRLRRLHTLLLYVEMISKVCEYTCIKSSKK